MGNKPNLEHVRYPRVPMHLLGMRMNVLSVYWSHMLLLDVAHASQHPAYMWPGHMVNHHGQWNLNMHNVS